MTRPRLDDPEEYERIKQAYFDNDAIYDLDGDPTEDLERLEIKLRHSLQSPR